MNEDAGANTEEPARKHRERGFVMVWMAMVIFVLLGVAAFAVDLVHAYVVGQQTQNAADAAALAGAAEIPADFNCAHGKAAADTILKKNLANAGIKVADVTVSYTCTANEMKVDVHAKMDTWFARAMNFNSLTVHRAATAEFDAKVKMGSPDNHLGSVPAGSCQDLGFPAALPLACASDAAAPLQQDLWAQIVGPDTTKNNGNPFTSNYCNNPTDGCTGNGAGNNTDYNSSKDPKHGEYFMIGNLFGGDMNVSIYDAGYVNVGGGAGAWCDNSNLITGTPIPNGNRIPDADLNHPSGPRYTGSLLPTPAVYSPYCAPDIVDTGAGAPFSNAPDVHYQLLAPDNDTDSNNNPPVPGCTFDINGLIPPDGATLASQPGYVEPDGSNAHTYFEKWATLCTMTNADATTPDHPYELHVWSTHGQGTNAFSVLALNKAGNAPVGMSVFSQEDLPLIASKPDSAGGGNPSTFYVARILPSSHDRTLDLSLFDFGDSPTSGGLPPISSVGVTIGGSNDVGGLPGGGCQYLQRTTGVVTPTAPWGGSPQSFQMEPSCNFTATVANWRSMWIDVKVDIPASYTCNIALPGGCWIKLTMDPGNHNLQDNTSWEATLNGAPERLTG